MKPRILFVDDDQTLNEVISEGLSHAFDVVTATDADAAYQLATHERLDAIVLDVHLKNEDGLHLCHRLRETATTRDIPVLVITGFGERKTMLSAYDLGADDYLEKPIDLEVLENRLHARIKRVEQVSVKGKTFGNLKVCEERSEIEIDGKTHRLKQTEFQILRLLLSNLNRNVTREEIMRSLWNDTHVGDRTIDVHVCSLRRKLKGFNYEIESLYGRGYYLRPAHP